MAESRHLLIFWEMLCFISGKSFLFQKIVVWGGGGCNPKKPFPSLTFSSVGVGFFWVLLGFFGVFWFFKKLIIFADFLYTQCENMHML